MTLQPEHFPIPMSVDEDGTLRIRDTWIKLEYIISRYQLAYTPDRIAADYLPLKLADVYSLIGYYLSHQEEIDAYLGEQDEREKQRWDSKEKLFERFGERLIYIVRDREIHYAEAFLDQKAPAAYGYKASLDAFSPEQIEFLKRFAVHCVDATIHDFLYMLEDAKWIRVRLESADAVLEDIRYAELGDLQGYGGIWAEKYSKERLDSI